MTFKSQIFHNVCHVSQLQYLKNVALDRETWHFKYPLNTDLSDKHAKMDVIDHAGVKDDFIAGFACFLALGLWESVDRKLFDPFTPFYCGISIKDRHRKDNIHIDYPDSDDVIKVVGLLNEEWYDEWGGGFIHDDILYNLKPGDFVIFDPTIPHGADDILTDTKRVAIDIAFKKI